MATFSAVTRQHILSAIAEYDDRGAENFLGVYGFGPSAGTPLVHDGKTYDPKAVLGVAHKYATGRAATAEEFGGGAQSPATILRKRGFDVDEPAGESSPPVRACRSAASSASATTTATKRRAPVPERVAPICPTCSMTLPGTGRCDDCD